uniref:Uncharacterized protein n=1 Tax=Araucaria cunninghamii TaxID=56994 RepID=A0A0D6R096_ARACU
MSVEYTPELGGISLNIQYSHSRSLKSHSLELNPSPVGNFAISHSSQGSEYIGGTPKMNHQSSPISPLSPQEAGSDSLPQISNSRNLNCIQGNQMKNDLMQSYSSNNDGTFKGQQYIHGLQYGTMHSLEGSLCMQSSSSGTSPISSQTSQTYSSDSQCFQSAETAAGQDGGGHGGKEQPVEMTHMLEQLATALLGPDSNHSENMEDSYEDHMLPPNSEWSLGALSDMNDFFDQNSQPVGPQKNNTDSQRVTEHLHQLPGHGNQYSETEGADEVESKIEYRSSESVSDKQNEADGLQIPQGDVKCLLIECAKAITVNHQEKTNRLIEELKSTVSIYGDPMKRLGAYMVEGLVARMHSTGAAIYKSLKCKEPTSSELLSYMHILYEVCPYIKFGYMAANGAIAEAFKDKDRVHIIDFQIAQGTQWVTLIQALAARPGGSPHVRITGVDDPVSEYARGEGLKLVGQRLSRLAESYQVPFEFHALPVFGSDVYAHMLDIRPEEALAVNFPLQLHHMPDESVSTSNHRDRLLRMVKGLAPNVVTLVEQEANTNTAPFLPRFMETLSYYSAMFESLDVTLPRESKDRVNVEQHCLARDIVNVIACEGAERVERHELLGKWRSRLTMAGFKSYPLSSHVNATIKFLLESYSANYRLVEKDEALYLGWLSRDLIVASAWK